MAEKLKPCHACGARAVSSTTKQWGQCGNEKCFMAANWYDVADWNTRAEPERHVLGVGYPRLLCQPNDVPRESIFLRTTPEMGREVRMDLPAEYLTDRYRLVLEKEPTDG